MARTRTHIGRANESTKGNWGGGPIKRGTKGAGDSGAYRGEKIWASKKKTSGRQQWNSVYGRTKII